MPNYVILIFIPFFILMSFYALRSIHKKSWNNLQEKFRYESNDFHGEKVRIKNISIEGLTSQNAIRIKISEQGLYMKFIFPFSLFSKPILIPWNEIKDIQNKEGLFSSLKRLVIGQPFVSTIEILDKDFYKISKYIDINKM